nr:multidrug effflux MFS transporter [Methylobrevis pamukkalensis]
MAMAMAMNALAIDMMLPALPDIGSALGVTDENGSQLVVTAYLLGFGFAQLFYGPMSDIWGRRRVLIAGIVIYVAFAGLASFAGSFEQLLFARAMQGVGAAATRVISVSIVRDCYGGRRMASVMSLIMLVFILVPVIAPALGQIVILLAPWRWVFGLLTLLGAFVLLWAVLRLPETLPPERRAAPNVTTIARAYVMALTNRVALGYTMATTLILGALFGFINQSQQVFVGVFDLGTMFPLAFASIALFMAAASFLNSKIVERLGMRLVSHAALIGFTLVSLLHVLVIAAGGESVWSFIALQSATMFMFGLVMSNFNAMAMEPLGHIAGTASSTLGFATTFGGALFGFFIGQHFDGTTLPLALGFTLLGAGALAIVFVTEGGRLFHARNVPAE